jgi:hypothetical protein
MKKELFLTALLVISIAACTSNGSKPSDTGSAPATTQVAAQSSEAASTASTQVAMAAPVAGAIKVLPVIPYQEGAAIKGAIKRECQIDTQLSEFIESYGRENGLEVARTPQAKDTANGRVLQVEIIDSVSQGNAFIGHRKATEIAGTLYQDGAAVASFRGMRVSGGGFFGGFKRSCSVLGRTVKALGSDVASWLKKPYDNALLGDL